MKPLVKSLVVASLIGVGAGLASVAEARVSVGIGIGVGVPVGYGWAPAYYGPGYWAPYGSYYYAPRVVVVQPAAQPVAAARPALPDPIFYPNQGQTGAQTETDRQDCNRWATSQPGAMADATVFQRATYACMEGRGYTVK